MQQELLEVQLTGVTGEQGVSGVSGVSGQQGPTGPSFSITPLFLSKDSGTGALSAGAVPGVMLNLTSGIQYFFELSSALLLGSATVLGGIVIDITLDGVRVAGTLRSLAYSIDVAECHTLSISGLVTSSGSGVLALNIVSTSSGTSWNLNPFTFTTLPLNQ